MNNAKISAYVPLWEKVISDTDYHKLCNKTSANGLFIDNPYYYIRIYNTSQFKAVDLKINTIEALA